MKTKTLKEYTDRAVKTMRGYDKSGTKKWNAHVALFDMPVQIGSLIKAYMQYENFRFAHGMSKKELKAKMADELADIFTEVLFIAHELDIDLEEAFEKMLESDSEKISKRDKKK